MTTYVTDLFYFLFYCFFDLRMGACIVNLLSFRSTLTCWSRDPLPYLLYSYPQLCCCCCCFISPNPQQNVWTYIGYACRMAVELGLNRYVANPPEDETDDQYRERRNRERTYLVLWVHDRSLSTQTGRHWMLPEDDVVRNSPSWHLSRYTRPEDVIVAAQVQLRKIAVRNSFLFLFFSFRARIVCQISFVGRFLEPNTAWAIRFRASSMLMLTFFGFRPRLPMSFTSTRVSLGCSTLM